MLYDNAEKSVNIRALLTGIAKHQAASQRCLTDNAQHHVAFRHCLTGNIRK